MASNINIVKDHSDSDRGNPLPPYMGYSFRAAARDRLYGLSHRQDNTYHVLCCISRGALAEMRNMFQTLTIVETIAVAKFDFA